MSWEKITDELHKFVNLPSSKQIIFVMMSVIVISFIFNVQAYLSKRKIDITKDKQIIEYKKIIDANLITKDSLVLVIYNIKLLNFENNLKRSDSLLKESQKIRTQVLKIKKNNMKTALLNIFLSLSFMIFPIFAAKEIYKDKSKLKESDLFYKQTDTLSTCEKIDSIDRLNKELNETTYKILQCDNEILSIKKKKLLQPRLHNNSINTSVVVEDTCNIISDTLTL